MVSVVINTRNAAEILPRTIASVKALADEIIVCDMDSTDGTSSIAKSLGARVFSCKYHGYVEPSRNYAISKAKGEWILILDADEEVSPSSTKKIKDIIKNPKADYYRLPRKNIIFGKWIKHSRWWPDFNIRFFKKGFVSWNEVIHAVPMTQGVGADLADKEDCAIIHHHYDTIDEYLERMIRYTKIQSEDLMKNGYVFNWRDIIKKPLGEFLSRYFAGEGYRDGVHGLAIGLLQAFSELVLYLRIWEKQGFKEKEIKSSEVKSEILHSIKDIKWWIRKELTWLKLPKFR